MARRPRSEGGAINRLQNAWDIYADAALPPDCSSDQRKVARRAFYAGMGGILSLISMLTDEGFDEDAANDAMKDIEQELREIQQEMIDGKD